MDVFTSCREAVRNNGTLSQKETETTVCSTGNLVACTIVGDDREVQACLVPDAGRQNVYGKLRGGTHFKVDM